MKKLLSVLLALAMVLSIGVMSFAADLNLEEASENFDKVVGEVGAFLEKPEVKKFLADAEKKIKDLIEDPEEAAHIADDLVDKIAAETGMDTEDIKQQISDSGMFDWFAKLYMPGVPEIVTTEAPEETTEEEIVETGSAVGGLAIFATLSIAAAAAFVCTKKN